MTYFPWVHEILSKEMKGAGIYLHDKLNPLNVVLHQCQDLQETLPA